MAVKVFFFFNSGASTVYVFVKREVVCIDHPQIFTMGNPGDSNVVKLRGKNMLF